MIVLYALLLLVGAQVTLVMSQQASYQMNCLSPSRYILASTAKNHSGYLISNNARMKYPDSLANDPYTLGWTLCVGQQPDEAESGVSSN
jgi:hypothetical protein